MLGIYRGKKR